MVMLFGNVSLSNDLLTGFRFCRLSPVAFSVTDLAQQELENLAGPQGTPSPWDPYLRMFMRAHTVHYHTFATKCEQYEDHAIVVGQLSASDSRLVAVACAAIKRVWLDGREEKAGWVW